MCIIILSQADHSMCSWFNICLYEMKRIYEGYEINKALKVIIAHLNHVGLNIPIKLNETLIDSCMVFFRFLGPSKASYCKITFGWR